MHQNGEMEANNALNHLYDENDGCRICHTKHLVRASAMKNDPHTHECSKNQEPEDSRNNVILANVGNGGAMDAYVIM